MKTKKFQNEENGKGKFINRKRNCLFIFLVIFQGFSDKIVVQACRLNGETNESGLMDVDMLSVQKW